jgi:hypothetical protein
MSHIGGEWVTVMAGLGASITCSVTPKQAHLSPNVEILGQFFAYPDKF